MILRQITFKVIFPSEIGTCWTTISNLNEGIKMSVIFLDLKVRNEERERTCGMAAHILHMSRVGAAKAGTRGEGAAQGPGLPARQCTLTVAMERAPTC